VSRGFKALSPDGFYAGISFRMLNNEKKICLSVKNEAGMAQSIFNYHFVR